MRFRLLHSGLTDTGRTRAGNEDAWAVDVQQGLYVVADGMGGHAAGEVAARHVVDALPQLMMRRSQQREADSAASLVRRLRSAVSRVSRDVFERSVDDPELFGMGATVVVAMFRKDEVVIAHLGDSRAYLLRDGRIRLLTKDHSVVQTLIDLGHITPDEAQYHPDRNRITASIGMPDSPAPDTRRMKLQPGDQLLLATDGLVNMINDERIAEILSRPQPPAAACRDLVDAANAAGGHDNVTVVVVQIAAEADEAPDDSSSE